MHRGAPGDVVQVEGRDVREVAHGWMVLRPRPQDHATRRSASDVVLEGASIPWHRVVRIELDGATLWERRAGDTSAARDGPGG